MVELINMKESDIRKRDTFNKYLALAKQDADKIFSDKSKFIEIECPGCATDTYELEFEKHGFKYVRCVKCDTLFVNPRPNEKDLISFYEDSPSTRYWVNDFFMPVAEERRKRIFRPRAEYIAQRFVEKGNAKTIGDIGAGFGLFLEELRVLLPKSKLVAIEPAKEMATICRDKGFSVIESPLEEVDSENNSFHLLTCFELFEHLHCPRSFLEKIYEILEPGGYFVVTTLNGLGFDIQLLWEESKSVSPPHHLNFFNPNSLRTLMISVGFEVIEISTPGKLDWDIVESGYLEEAVNPGRFFQAVSKYGTDDSKEALQDWIRDHNFSSHMRVVAKRLNQ